MSSLSQMLERRRAADGESWQACHTMEAQPACLLVNTATGESWVFPWTQLAVAHFTKTDERESLKLVFTSHEVRLSGLNLSSLRDLVAALQLARVQPAASKYQKTTAEPFLDSIHVSPLKLPSEQSGASV